MRMSWILLMGAVMGLGSVWAKSGDGHVADMCTVFGTSAVNPHLGPVFRAITSEMDDSRTGRQKYTLNQRMKAIEPNFKWGLYTHRIFFHWGFNGSVYLSAALKEKIEECTQDEGKRRRLWKVVEDEQVRRNKRMLAVTERSTTYIGSDGKLKGFAKHDVINGIAALAYDTHILGDYVEGKDVPMKALVALESVQKDIVKSLQRITENDPDFSGTMELKRFVTQMNATKIGIDKIRAQKILLIMIEQVPGILMKSGTVRRVLELEKYSTSSVIDRKAA